MKNLMLCFCLFTLVFSCTESDDSGAKNTVSKENFYALTVGNSWVYKNYKYNYNTKDYDDTGVIDSISILGTEDILGVTYFKFRRLTTGNEKNITFCNPNGEHFEWLRESNGNLIRDDGSIKFTNNNYEERLTEANDWGNIYETLAEEKSTIVTEAGEFTCVYSERYAKNPDGIQEDGLDRFYYADGVGLISDSSSFVKDSIPSIIRRLAAYETIK